MQFQILHPGTNAVLFVSLGPDELIKAEAGAMVAKSSHVEIRGKMWGGFFGAMKRSTLGGETFFFQELKSPARAGDAIIAPSVPGDVKLIPISHGEDFYVQSGCLLAALDGIELNTKAQKLTAGLFSGAGFFVLHLKGEGHFAVSAFGAIMEIPIPADQKYTIDNGHVVAWSGDTSYKIVKAAKTWMSSITSGEGLACEFTGPGKVWIQTRNPKAFGQWVRKYAPSGGGISLLSFLG
jgi:uncharacterized protein (TIGR00266 family)